MSVELAALKLPWPYAFIADVTASATTFVSPNPAAAAFADTSRIDNAVAESRIPAEVIKYKASASSSGPRVVAPAKPSVASFILFTSSALTPTRPLIRENESSKFLKA